jgi:hypothetical protein
MPHVVLSSPDFSALAFVFLLMGAKALLLGLVVVAAGVTIYRRAKGHARTAAIVAPLAVALPLALWTIVFGFQSEWWWFPISQMVPVAAIATVVLYPVAWSCLTLTASGSVRTRAAATIVVLAALVGAVRYGAPYATLWCTRLEAGLSGDPHAFRALLAATERDSAMFEQLTVYLGTPDMRVWIAQNPSAPPDVLTALARSPDRHQYAAFLARRNPNIPIAVLTDSFGDVNVVVEWAIAKPPRVRTETLDSLARIYPSIRNGLGMRVDYMNERAAPSTLRILSTDSSFRTRRAVARSPHTPPDVLDILAHDTSGEVRTAVAWSPNTSDETLAGLMSDTSPFVRAGLRHHGIRVSSAH